MIKCHFLPLNIHGCCKISTNEIFISTELSALEMVDTALHELAHILSGKKEHNKEWHKIYQKLGGNGEAKEIAGLGDYCLNIGNVTGIQNLLVDYVLLLQYRKFSQRTLGTEGQWEFKVEAGGDGSPGKIRLFPTPKGTFPVIVEYLPSVTEFKSPEAREVTFRAMVAKTKIAVGHARRKLGGIPSPDGGQINLDGDSLVSEGKEEYKALVEEAINLGEPLGPYLY